jgi:hypothetical protein
MSWFFLISVNRGNDAEPIDFRRCSVLEGVCCGCVSDSSLPAAGVDARGDGYGRNLGPNPDDGIKRGLVGALFFLERVLGVGLAIDN